MENSKLSTVCAIDNVDYGDIEALNKAVRWTHKMKQEDYYKKYFPMKDLFTGDDIEFKSPEYYLSNLFNGRASMNSYLRGKNTQEIETVVSELLRLRREIKGINIAPGELESKTITFPAVSALIAKGVNYPRVCNAAGSKCPYAYGITQIETVKHPFKLTVDTREQKPLIFKDSAVEIKREKLDFGDYADANCLQPLAIERKSLADYIGTLSRGYERFERECARARDAGHVMVVLVETTLAKATSFNYSSRNFSQCDPKFVFSKMRKLLTAYPNVVQFLFVDGRPEAARVMLNLFSWAKNPLNWDLQYLYNTVEL